MTRECFRCKIIWTEPKPSILLSFTCPNKSNKCPSPMDYFGPGPGLCNCCISDGYKLERSGSIMYFNLKYTLKRNETSLTEINN